MKKNYRKIPKHISAKLSNLHAAEIMVGCAITISRDRILAGELRHLDVVLTEEGLKCPAEILPAQEQGKCSYKNRNGETIVRKDLPKEHRTRSFDAPDWNGYGTHQVDIPYEAYQRFFNPPTEAKLSLHCENPAPNQESYVLIVKVNEVLAMSSEDFNARLLFDVNLLQENLGACDVETATSSAADYLRSLRVSWDILPPGNLEEVMRRLFSRRKPTQSEIDQTTVRFNFFNGLSPQNIIVGASGFSRYFGAQINTNLVVFENIAYGNAIYVLFDNWKELSQRSRVDLLSGKYGDNFERIPHVGEWEAKVRKVISERRE